jgi:hypothetical protein
VFVETRGLVVGVGLALAVLGGAGCGEAASPAAPTQLSVTVSAAADIVLPDGVAPLTAVVADQSGAPAPDGTTVQFTTTLGRVDPPQAITRLGRATTNFIPGGAVGLANVRAQVGAVQSGPVQLSVGDSGVQVAVGAQALGGLNVVATANVQGGQGVQFEWFFERGANPEVISTSNEARYIYPSPGFKDLTVRVLLADGRRILGSAAVIVD